LLARLDLLPELGPYVEACDRLSAEITAIDLDIPRATQKLGACWRGFQTATTLSGATQVEAPEVTEARAEVAALQAQRTAVATEAAAARADLQVATVQLKASLLPALREQLGAPIDQLLHGLEASLSVERLLGPTGGHVQGRELARLLLAYLTAVRDVIGEE